MTRVLISGGTGFIGSRLALDCLERGQHVRVLAQQNTPAERWNSQCLLKRGAEIVEGSVTDLRTLRRACAGVDLLFHLAAAQHEANVPDEHFYAVNVEGTRNMLRAAKNAGVQRFVHGSSIGVYGTGGTAPVGDESPLEPDNIYGVTKLEAERVVHQFFSELPIAVVRISESYGPGDRRLLKLFKGVQSRRFFRIGPGRNLHHTLYIEDLIEGLSLAATRSEAPGRTFVLAGPRAVSTDELIDEICQAMEVGLPRIRVPLSPLRALGTMMEALMCPLGLQPPLHPRRMNFFVKSFQFSCAEARKHLGFRPRIDVREGIQRTVGWYKQMEML